MHGPVPIPQKQDPTLALRTFSPTLRHSTYPTAAAGPIAFRKSEWSPRNGKCDPRATPHDTGRRDPARRACALPRAGQLGDVRLREHRLVDERGHAVLRRLAHRGAWGIESGDVHRHGDLLAPDSRFDS